MSSVRCELDAFLIPGLGPVDPITEFGVVEKVVGNTIESHGPNVTMGCVCWLENQGKHIPVEVVGFTDGKVISMPLGKIDGVTPGRYSAGLQPHRQYRHERTDFRDAFSTD